MDHAAGVVAMQVHESTIRRAEQRIAQARAAAERMPVAAPSGRGIAAAAAVPLRRLFRRHAPRFAQ
ncbi:hypothetical protein [Agromyces sp. SYSU T0242]|uniref:hypothetical protein n=1 Tax=Agromyces litoreus TaxID=3158561 RepID=UPI0033989B0C